MNKILSAKLILVLIIVFASVGIAAAQDTPPPEGMRPNLNGPPPDGKRPNLMRELGLSVDQMQQIRRINQTRKPQMDEAMKRLRDANRALDEAIYADNVDDSAFQTRLKELQQAQSEVARLRFTSELAIRKVLTPDQLARFRELRRRFEEAIPNRQGPPPGADEKQPVPQQFRKPPM